MNTPRESEIISCSSGSYFLKPLRNCSVKPAWFYCEQIIWVLSFSEATLRHSASWSQGFCSEGEMNTSSFVVWRRRENVEGSKEIHLLVDLGLQVGTFRYPDSLVFVNKQILKTPESQSVPVKTAWVLPILGSHETGNFKNCCLQVEVKASTFNKWQLLFIRNAYQTFSNLIQIITSAELAWKPLWHIFTTCNKAQDLEDGGKLSQGRENNHMSQTDSLSDSAIIQFT